MTSRFLQYVRECLLKKYVLMGTVLNMLTVPTKEICIDGNSVKYADEILSGMCSFLAAPRLSLQTLGLQENILEKY